MLAPINAAIAAADRHIAELVATDPVVLLLTTAPTIGPVTAAAFVATLDDVTRFASAEQVSAYLGLVPSEHSSGERRHRGRITKTATPACAGSWSRRAGASCARPILACRISRRWGLGIADRRGTRVAVVALARKLAIILYAMWRDTTPYRAARSHTTEVAA